MYNIENTHAIYVCGGIVFKIVTQKVGKDPFKWIKCEMNLLFLMDETLVY